MAVPTAALSVSRCWLRLIALAIVCIDEQLLGCFCISDVLNRRWLIFPLIMKKLLLLLALLAASLCANACHNHINNLTRLLLLNRTKFMQQIHGYLLYSGKMINDLGLPDACHKYQNYRYFTGEVRGQGEQYEHRGYLGICFSSQCTSEDMSQNAGMSCVSSDVVVNSLLNISIMSNTTKMSFVQPVFQSSVSAGAIIFLIVFLLLLAVSLKQTVFSFFRSCSKQAKKQDEQLYGKYAIQFGDDYDPNLLVVHQHQGFFKKHCLATKLHQYFTAEQSTKIIAFSGLRILAVPLSLYGYLFYLGNIASFNYNAFEQEIYSQNYSRIAVAAYYIPDILFFISGFLLAKKAFALIQIQPRAEKALVKVFYQKVLKWLPIYWAVIIIYWQISPALHSGPVWYEYQAEVAVCNTRWWQALLFIDNWFQSGCYNFAWYIPAEIQLSLLGVCLMWVYLKNKRLGIIILVALFLTTWILTLTISAPFPASLDSMLSSTTITYFKSTYSHMPYYLLGVINGYLGHHQRIKETLQKLTHNKIFRVIGIVVGVAIMTVIVVRPSIWGNQLGFQLGLAKTGMFLSLYLLIFWSMFGNQSKTTLIHRLAILSKGVMLVGGMVVASFFWSGYSFPYLDDSYLVKTSIANLLIGMGVGVLVSGWFWARPRKQEQPIL